MIMRLPVMMMMMIDHAKLFISIYWFQHERTHVEIMDPIVMMVSIGDGGGVMVLVCGVRSQ